MQPPPPPGPPGPPQGQSNGLGLTAMILGIVSIPLICCFYLGIPVGIAAAVLGFMGKNKVEQGLATNRGQAMAGLICGIIATVLGVILLVVALSGIVNYEIPTN